MIYVVLGTDESKARAKWHAVVESLVAKRPDASLFVMDAEQGTPAQLEELLAGQSLFAKKYIVACDHILQNADLAALVHKYLDELAKAEHLFVLLEKGIDKKTLSVLEKQAFKVVTFDRKADDEKAGFNIFTLTEALSARDRRRLWILYQQVLRSEEFSEEDIFWKLAWQIKNLLLVKTAKDPSTLGMHPYALKKTLASANKFSLEELNQLYGELTELYHNTRRGLVEFGIGLEQFILTI